MLFNSMIILSSMMIITILISLNLLIKFKKKMMSKTPFECGFSYNKPNLMLPFSVQFFMISLMFIIFDIEISMLVPMILPIHNSSPKMFTQMIFIFLTIMWAGLIYEWYESSMKWKI